jgi:hypothetical protein
VLRRQQPASVDGHDRRRVELRQVAGEGIAIGGSATQQQQRRLGRVQDPRRFADGGRRWPRRHRQGGAGGWRQTLRRGGDDIQRQLDMDRPRPGTGEEGEGPGHHFRQLFRPRDRMAEAGDLADELALVLQLMQPAFAGADLPQGIDRGDDKHRHGIAIGLGHGGGDIGHARPGDDEADAGPAGDAGIAIGHESGTLLMARRHVADRRIRQAAIELHRMDPRNAEDDLDAIGSQQLGQIHADGLHADPPRTWHHQ